MFRRLSKRVIAVVGALLIGMTGTAVAGSLPPRPLDPVLDTARVFTPEMLVQLNNALSQEGRNFGIHIFMLTQVATEKGDVEAVAQQAAAAWLHGEFGAVLVFDDSIGRLSIEPSDEFTKRFHEFQLKSTLVPLMGDAKREKFSHDRLAQMAIAVAGALRTLKVHGEREVRILRVEQIAFAIFMAGALLLLALHSRGGHGAESDADIAFDP